MKKSVWTEKLPGGYSVRYWKETSPGAFRQQREWFADYNTAQKFAANKRMQLLAKQQGTADPTLKPSDLFDLYLQTLAHTHRPETIELKTHALKSYFQSNTQLTNGSLKVWKTEMLKAYNINTVGLRLREMRAFCNWCVKEGYLQESPFKGVEVPQGKEVGRKLEIAELRALLENADPSFKPYLMFLVHTGARRTETLKTKWSDLDLKAGTWTIPGENSKSKKTRYVPLDPALTELLTALPKPSSHVFEGWTTNTPHFRLRQAARRAGILGRLRLHDLRHTFASHWQGDPRILADVVGWSGLGMLRRYSHFNLENARREASTKGIGSKL